MLLVVIAACAIGATGVTSLDFTVAQINAAAERAMESLHWGRENDVKRGRTLQGTAGAAEVKSTGFPSALQRHLQSRRASKRTAENAVIARLFEETTRELIRGFEGTAEEARQAVEELRGVNVSVTLVAERCSHPSVPCEASHPYRSPDGTCNNIRHPFWGSEGSCTRRLLPPAYEDNVGTPRVAKSGKPLPSARRVSYTVHSDANKPAVKLSHNVMQMGQFINHDFALTQDDPTPPRGNCCSASARNSPGCYSIDVPSDDPFFRQFGTTCLSMRRSAPCTTCELGHREQSDSTTSFLDGSAIYGSNKRNTMQLRLHQGGLLRTQSVGQSELLPRNLDPTRDRCSNPSKEQYCFDAGDNRVNENPALAATHTVWLRQHNRLAVTLGRLTKKSLTDEQLFQTAKRIVESQLAHIVYSEWLPLILGPTIMKNYSLTPKTSGYTTYDRNVDPTMINEFAAAAFRIGHTLIDGKFLLGTSPGASFDLKDNYFFPFDLYDGKLDSIIQGMLRQPAQNLDESVTTGVTNHLYRKRNKKFGLDLIALNLQRGRDHGLQPYTEYLKLCRGVTVKTFDDLKPFVRQAAIDQYKRLYEDVTDIDLFTAGISEHHVPDGNVGPTFGCILGKMFKKLKFGDRFFYEHGNEAGSFTTDQLKEIRKTTYARILCDNSDAIDSIPLNVFKPPGTGNPTKRCKDIPQPDLKHWV